MTSLAFVLGITPLVNPEGAGAASRRSLGTALTGGMLVSTLLSLFIVPVLYIVINLISDRFKPGGKKKNTKKLNTRSEVKSPTAIH
jgi:HAE1 family hydrophobic/amphiphilic exporter-1